MLKTVEPIIPDDRVEVNVILGNVDFAGDGARLVDVPGFHRRFAIGQTVGAAVVYSAVSYTNTPLQGRISFGASPWQHFGMAVNVDSVSNNYWALFSTKGTTNRLNARVNSNGTTTDVDIGALPGGFHDYEIQPNGSGFAFYVDGVLMTTIAASFQTTVPLRAVLSNFVGTSGQLLQADSAGFVQYSTTQTGTFTSIVFDAGQSVTWDKMASTVTVPTGTTLAIAVKVGTRQTDGSIQWYLPVVGSDGLIRDQAGNLVLGQYLQYIVTMTTTSTTKTPVLDDISFTWM